ncbi:hypothetical protein TCA2_4566 [Paenibacillus sp. TCA20]|uniref:hypothetical protein n=1 Tax=Paenibacillus sp. TCA20 TaxID=1499968 RepID=UPI0004D6CC56|nr:hypothetical protein [Paenibacillus sp. TCA20]GAK42074.1 hypothetical protein TCA2_4566 [Paenibacillus sp. TCA20]
MIKDFYRIACIISVKDQNELDKVFVYDDYFTINETMNQAAIGQALCGGMSMQEVFQNQIDDYIQEYGIQPNRVTVVGYQTKSGHKDISVVFYKDGVEQKVQTADGSMKAVAYYHKDERLDYGLELFEFDKALPNGKLSLRVGEQVPTGDVNLAYIHSPRINVEENVSLIDTSSVNENVIPIDQIESLVVPDANGVLSYADVVSDDQPIIMRPPYSRFPSKNINITRRFTQNETVISNALFYKFELKYHYDSDPGEAGKVIRYTGSQIQLTDENGNLLGPEFKRLIYAQATEQNPKIYWVKIYIQSNTDEEQTFKVRYNHVETPAPDEELKSTTKTVELYSNQGNVGLIEGGKLRVINGIGAYEQVTAEDLRAAEDIQEVYSIEEYPDKDGYKITVPQRSMNDPRARNAFNYKLSATYLDDKNNQRTLTFGYVSDWTMNADALLAHEKLEFTGEYKTLGVNIGGGYVDARSLIQSIMPVDMPSLPMDAIFKIEDASGNLLYTTQTASDNGSVESIVAESGSSPAQAKSNTTTAKWTGASGSNVKLKNNPIEHQVTVYPEQQKSEVDFTWEASGSGEIITSQSYQGRWKVCQNVTIEKAFTAKPIDVFTGWDFIGSNETRGKWEYNKARDVLLLTVNKIEVSGYYNGAHKDKENYIFSACVTVNDHNDDDVIGIQFRVNNDKEYYCFLWEKDQLMREPGANGNGVGRVLVDERGVSAVLYYKNPDPNKFNSAYEAETNMTKYMSDYGFKNRKKGIFKASPTTLPPYSDALHPNCQYKSDRTGSSFENITSNVNYNAKGWVPGETYKIRVVVAGSKFQVYIGNDTSDDALGTLVCEAEDSTYSKGSYGICNISQENALWSKLKFTELDVHELCTDWENVTLTSNDWVKVSDKKPADILTPLIEQYMKDTYGNDMPYTVTTPSVVGDPADLRAEVRNDGYIWAVTNSSQAGGTLSTPWLTSDNRKNITGTGKAVMRADGVMDVTLTPPMLTKDNIPIEVQNFSWNRIWATSGEGVNIRINGDNSVSAEVDVPPIIPIGAPLTLPLEGTDKIYKQEGMKSMGLLFGTGNILEKLNISSSVPANELLLRIERGDSAGNNRENRVNYRWHYNWQNREYFEVDQANRGVNRMRMKNILQPGTTNVIEGLTADLVAWTTFEELESVPVLAIKIDDDKKIEMEKPKVERDNTEIDNWYVRVKNGRVKKRYVLPYYEAGEKVPQLYVSYPELIPYAPMNPEERKEIIMDYTVPEYTNQEFYNEPVILIDREHPVILNDKAIQVGFTPIAMASEAGVSYLEVEAIRMNQSRKLRVSDIDAKKGIIYLHDRIRDQDEVIVRYAYVEDWYTYRGYNRSGEFFHLDLNPSPGHRFTMAQDGFHEWVPGDVTLRESYTTTEKQSNELLVRQMHVYLRPTSIWIQEESGPQLISGTTRNQAIFHTDDNYWFEPDDYNYDPSMLRLGKVTVQANSSLKKDVVIMDTRTRGGGLDEALSKAVIAKVNKESLYHWDIGYFDGEAYQENGVIIVRLPRSILATPNNPNGFSEAEVQAAVAKHKGYGILPIIEYYDLQPTDLNVLGNPEFLYGKHLNEYNTNLSSGLYFINQQDLGTGDNSILQIEEGGVYGILLSTANLEYSDYTLDIKAKKMSKAEDRSAAVIRYVYRNGETAEVPMATINSEDWMIYTADIMNDGNIDSIIIQVNSKEAKGGILVDYVKMFPKFTEIDGVEFIEL